MHYRLLILIAKFSITLALFAASGCAGTGGVRALQGTGISPPHEEFFAHLDTAVETAGAGHGAWARVPGYPYLRSDRFLNALKDRLEGEDLKRWWIDQLQTLDLKTRVVEIGNLPPERLNELARKIGLPADRSLLIDRMRKFSGRWLESDRKHPDFIPKVKEAVSIPEEYSTAMRVVGLYPITALPVAHLTHRAQNRFRSWHSTPLENLTTQGTLTTFAPERAGMPVVTDLEKFFSSRPRNSFGLPQLAPADEQRLVLSLAPVIRQDVAADYDRIGRVGWQASMIHVDTDQPTVYYYLSRAFLKGVAVIQINYVFWYPGRLGPNPPAIERGPLDGLTFRVTLDRFGRPAVIDIMNNCGCYHFFIPRKEEVAGSVPAPLEVDPFIPRWMPHTYPAESLLLRVNSGWHQVDHVGTVGSTGAARTYRLVAYETLEALPREDGHRESLFYPTGIAKNSERIEPYLLFSMGIPKVGSMRQRGHHPLKLVGRSYFDDPWLLDKSLIYR